MPVQGPAPTQWMFKTAPVNCTSPGRERAGSCSKMEPGGEEGALEGCHPRGKQQIGSVPLGLTRSLAMAYMGSV